METAKFRKTLMKMTVFDVLDRATDVLIQANT